MTTRTSGKALWNDVSEGVSSAVIETIGDTEKTTPDTLGNLKCPPREFEPSEGDSWAKKGDTSYYFKLFLCGLPNLQKQVNSYEKHIQDSFLRTLGKEKGERKSSPHGAHHARWR
jgi:hypothetical protein